MWRVKLVRNSFLLASVTLSQLLPAQEADPCRNDGAAASAECIQSLQKQIAELKTLVQQMRTEVSSGRDAVMELRKELSTARGASDQALASSQQPPPTPEPGYETGESVPPSQQPGAHGDPAEELALLNAKINEQYQTKVESARRLVVECRSPS